MLIFPIKNPWFGMIERGEKREEYREDTPYYQARLERYRGQEIECVLRNGYSSSSPSLKIRATVDKGTGRPELGAEPGKIYYKLIIHEQERLEPEIFVIKARRCERCGGLLTSSKAVSNGMGHTCLMRAREEERRREFEENQVSLEDVLGDSW